MHFKGTNSFKLNLTPKDEGLFKSLTIDFLYEEPLPEKMVFFKNLNENGETYCEITLELNDSNGRKVKLHIPSENFTLELLDVLEEKKVH